MSDKCGGIPMDSLITAQRVLVVANPFGTLNWGRLAREQSQSDGEARQRTGGMARPLRSDKPDPRKVPSNVVCTDPSL